MKQFWARERNRLLVFIFCILIIAAALLLFFLNNSLKATQDTFMQTQVAQYEDDYGSSYYEDYSIQYQPSQAVTTPLVIGVCMDDLQSSVQSAFVDRLLEEARAQSISVIVLDSRHDPQQEVYNIIELTMRKVKTIIWAPVPQNSSAYQAFTQMSANVTQEDLTFKIKKANIPLINIINRVDIRVTDMVDSFVVVDENEYLKLAAAAISDVLGQRGPSDVWILSSPDYPLFDATFAPSLEASLGLPGHVYELGDTAVHNQSDLAEAGCIFLADPTHLAYALDLYQAYGVPVICGYVDEPIARCIQDGTIQSAISLSPAALSKNAANFSANLMAGVKAPVSADNILYIINHENLLSSADTWYFPNE